MPSDSAAAAQMEVDDQMQEVTVSDALKALSDPEVSTEAPLPVQKIITDRLAGFPGINETAHSHNTLAYLPKEVVILLQQYPALIASVVDIFYLRDQIQLRDCSKMARFPPETADGVQTQVRMTRPLYAQLVSQRFYPPKPFERAKWFAGLQEGTAEWRRRDLGMKIVSYFPLKMLGENCPHWRASRLGLRLRNAVCANKSQSKEDIYRSPERKSYNDIGSGYANFYEPLGSARLFSRGARRFVKIPKLAR